jgi:copper chaperone
VCEAHAALAAAGEDASSMPEARIYTVKGMTCDNCATSVTQGVVQVPGVAATTVDLQAATLVVGGEGFTDDAVRAAVDEAGYELVGS